MGILEMSQPVMANPIISSLSGLRNGTVFLTLVTADARRPIPKYWRKTMVKL